MNTRREFLAVCGKLLTGATISSALLPILDSCTPSTSPLTPSQTTTLPVGPDGRYAIDVADLSDAKPLKEVANLIGPDGMPVLITRLDDADFRALSMLCTHEGCQIEDSEQNGAIPCLCHGSKFGLDGSVIVGPATSALHQYDAIYDVTSNTLHVKVA